MKQLAQYQNGRLELQEVPVPIAPSGGILVRVTHSVISPGTEKMKVQQARMNLLQKAQARPDQVKKVMETAKNLGWKAAIEKVRNRLESPSPLGYSAAGIVEAVHPANNRFKVGDRVACGGAECANHAEYIAVPDLLAAPVPDGVENWQAAYTTLGSISLQAVRQADVRLGERVMVIGQGLVGLLATALCHASGARVLAVDRLTDRLQTASSLGAELTATPDQAEQVASQWTSGFGVDAVLICVGGNDNKLIETAVSALRDRGQLIIVGMFDAALDWKTCYMKDIQVRYSRSYGPGRYDLQYEWGGTDYPEGYVRWTENRNFQACLHLMKEGRLNLNALTTSNIHFSESVQAYEKLVHAEGGNEIGMVIHYEDHSSNVANDAPLVTQEDDSSSSTSKNSAPKQPVNTLDVIGAGNFARTMLLPFVQGQVKLGTIVNRSGLSAEHCKNKFGFDKASADPADVFQSAHPASSAVLIGTRHSSHAELVIAGLQAGKHVFVEKPLCLSFTELSDIDTALAASAGSVMVGFNRRFAPATLALQEIVKNQNGPVTLSYHVYAGRLAPDHWYANIAESGGRLLGEACHFFDYACYVLDSVPVKVTAHRNGDGVLDDSFTAQVSFKNGSSFQLIYSALGDRTFPKETIRLFADDKVVETENFQSLTTYENGRKKARKFSGKGHAEEMAQWLGFLKGNQLHPLPYEQARLSTLLTLAAGDSIRENRTITF